MTINQVIAFCLVAVLIGFLVVVAIMAKHAIALLKKTKKFVGVTQEVVEEVSGKADELVDGAMTAVNNVIADTSTGVKAVASVGIGLTLFNFATGFVKSILSFFGLIPANSSRKERKRAAKEIKLSQKTIREMNKQAKAERLAFARAEKESKRLHKKELENAKREAKVAKAEQKLMAKIEAKEAKLAARVAATAAAAEAKALKAEAKAAVRAARAEQAAEAITLRAERRARLAEKIALLFSLILKRRAAKKDARRDKKIIKKAAKKAKIADKKQAKKLNKQNKKAAAKAARSAKAAAAKAAKKAAKK